jgi:predicted transcriptional regulator
MSADHPITGSPDQPILTALRFLILAAIHRHGPQSDMSLWHHSKCQTLTAILVAIAELADAGFIEKFRANTSYWQLTEKGRQQVTPAAGEQEVLCNNH